MKKRSNEYFETLNIVVKNNKLEESWITPLLWTVQTVIGKQIMKWIGLPVRKKITMALQGRLWLHGSIIVNTDNFRGLKRSCWHWDDDNKYHKHQHLMILTV